MLVSTYKETIVRFKTIKDCRKFLPLLTKSHMAASLRINDSGLKVSLMLVERVRSLVIFSWLRDMESADHQRTRKCKHENEWMKFEAEKSDLAEP